MDKQIQPIEKKPDFIKIYRDIIKMKYPDKEGKCICLLSKKELSALEIIQLDQLIFENGDLETKQFNRNHRFYRKSDIIDILKYQKEYNINNSELARHYKLSRNTVAKWKKIFLI